MRLQHREFVLLAVIAIAACAGDKRESDKQAQVKPAPPLARVADAAPAAAAKAAPPMRAMSGPHASIDAVPAPEDLEPRKRLGAAKAPSAPILAAEVYQYGEVIPAEHALCRVAIRLADGWYLSEPFDCGDADNRTSTSIKLHEVALADGKVVVRYQADFDGWNMDNDGIHGWEHTQFEVHCALQPGGKPACSNPQRGKSESGSEPIPDE